MDFLPNVLPRPKDKSAWTFAGRVKPNEQEDEGRNHTKLGW